MVADFVRMRLQAVSVQTRARRDNRQGGRIAARNEGMAFSVELAKIKAAVEASGFKVFESHAGDEAPTFGPGARRVWRKCDNR